MQNPQPLNRYEGLDFIGQRRLPWTILPLGRPVERNAGPGQEFFQRGLGVEVVVGERSLGQAGDRRDGGQRTARERKNSGHLLCVGVADHLTRVGHVAKLAAKRHQLGRWADQAVCGFGLLHFLVVLKCGASLQPGHVRLSLWVYQSISLAIAAPSTSAPSLAQAMSGKTLGYPAKVANPQSAEAITRSRPTKSA